MTWLVVTVLVVCTVISYELFLRSRGYRPSVKDDEHAWAWERLRVADKSSRTVALLGSSRIMVSFSPRAFEEALPGWRYAQLGINGTTAIGALLDLARDSSFRGVAIIDVSEAAFVRDSWPSQDKYIATYHRRWRTPGAMLERWLTTQVQSRLAILATRGVGTFGKLLRNGAWPRPYHVVMYPDRNRFVDFSLLDLERANRRRLEHMEEWDKTTRDADAWLADAYALEPAIAAIQARGGQVVYLRTPTCGVRWENDERMFAKARFWDRLAASTRAVAIHFKDHPQLARFGCPDMSHIDSKDGPAFTHALLSILLERGVFD